MEVKSQKYSGPGWTWARAVHRRVGDCRWRRRACHRRDQRAGNRRWWCCAGTAGKGGWSASQQCSVSLGSSGLRRSTWNPPGTDLLGQHGSNRTESNSAQRTPWPPRLDPSPPHPIAAFSLPQTKRNWNWERRNETGGFLYFRIISFVILGYPIPTLNNKLPFVFISIYDLRQYNAVFFVFKNTIKILESDFFLAVTLPSSCLYFRLNYYIISWHILAES